MRVSPETVSIVHNYVLSLLSIYIKQFPLINKFKILIKVKTLLIIQTVVTYTLRLKLLVSKIVSWIKQ